MSLLNGKFILNKSVRLFAIMISLVGATSAYSQTLLAENEDAFIVKVDRGFFSRNTPENIHAAKRKGWAFVIAKSKEMGCTHLGGIHTTWVNDRDALLRGSLAMPRFNTSWMWERPGGGFVQVMESPQHLVDFDAEDGDGFACSRGAPTRAGQWFKDIATLERELRFEKLID